MEYINFLQIEPAQCLFIITFALLAAFNSNYLANAEVDKSGVKPQVISLPKGPGSIEGLGESFEPQLNSGTTTYSIKFNVQPGIKGFQPELALRYNGGGGNSIVGIGWDISIGHIQRQTDKGFPLYQDSDIFIESGGEELVPVENGFYRHEHESGFMRYKRVNDGWIANSKSGIIYKYGTNTESQIRDGENIFRWLLDEMQDTNGNIIKYQYSALDDSNQRYCKKITYNGHQIEFNYEKRGDSLSDYRSGFKLTTSYRCLSVSMVTDGNLVRRYNLNYDSSSYLSLLQKVTQIGKDGISSLPPAVFTYTKFDPLKAKVTTIKGIDDTSLPPFLILSSEPDITLNDMNADSLPDILVAKAGWHEVYLNLGIGKDGIHRWGSSIEMDNESPGEALGNDGVSLADIDGDGKTDFIAKYPSNETYFLWRNLGNGKWDIVKEFGSSSILPFDFEDPAARLVDINNDKFIDVMYCNDPSGELYSYFINNKGERYDTVIEKSGIGSAMTFDQQPGMKLADMNGDRLQDILLLQDKTGICMYWASRGLGEWDSPVEMNTPLKNGELNTENILYNWSSLMPIDFNGDGLTDLVYIPEGGYEIIFWLNKNSVEFALPQKIAKLPCRLGNTTIEPADMNGNGTVDILWNYPEDSDIHRDKVWQYVDISPDEKPNLLKTVTNGTGRTITFNYSTTSQESLRDKDTAPWSQNVPNTVTVLSSFDIKDGRGNIYKTEIAYHEGYYDGEEKEFRGFAKAEKTEKGDTTIPDLVMSYKFFTGAGVDKEALKGKPIELQVKTLSGDLFHKETYNWKTKVVALGIDENSSSYNSTIQEKEIIFPYQAGKSNYIIEKGVGEPVILKWDYEYDDYGNQTRQIEYGRLDEGWNDEKITDTTYTSAYPSGQSLWILDKVVSQDVMDENGKYASKKSYYYDDSNTLGSISKGNLTKTEEWVSGDEYIITSQNDYDSYGNITAIYDPLYGLTQGSADSQVQQGHYREIVYDNIYHTFPVQEKIHTGTTTLNISAMYDPGSGVMKSSTDFNGNTTTYDYDTFARLAAITKPLDTKPTVEYSYVLAHSIGNGNIINWVETRQRDDLYGSGALDNGFLYSRTFYDGLGRKIMTRAEGESSGQIVVTDTVQFNARKEPWKKYLPYFEQPASLDFVEPTFNTGFTEHYYDALGREIKTYQPQGADGRLFSTTTYEPLAKTVRDEEQTKAGSIHSGCGMRYVEDGLQDKDGKGRLREVYEIVKVSDTGTPLSQSVEWKTSYNYDLLNNLTDYTDSQNNRKFIEYDWLGRKTFMNDPDRGITKYWYDNAGNLIKTQDAKGQIIQYKYDGANRLIEEYYGAVDNSPDVAYHYDFARNNIFFDGSPESSLVNQIIDSILTGQPQSGFDLNHDGKTDVADVVTAAKSNSNNTANDSGTLLAENTLGYLSWIEDQSGEEYNSYDERGRVKSVIKKIKSSTGTENLQSFQTSMNYDAMDRVTELVYPDYSSVIYKYNSRGLLESVPDVIESYNYNPAGQNALLTLECGTETSYQYDHRLRLSKLQTTRSLDNSDIQNLSYIYDGVSNITKIVDGRDDSDFYQIGQELGISLSEVSKSNSTQSFVYDSLYRLTSASNPQVYGTINYRYDRIGNMIHKSSDLIDVDEDMNLGTMSIGGSAGAYGRHGRNSGDAPGPHALTSIEKSSKGAMQFIYDANGNMTTNRGNNLKWDLKDRLSGLTNENGTANYLYDYTDSRKRKFVTSDNGSAEEVLYIDKFSEVRDGTLIKYVYAGSSRIARQKGYTSNNFKPDCFFLQDHLGSANITLSNAGFITEQTVNYPFGKQRVGQKDGASVCNADYQFTGKERDKESDLMYFEARYYDGVVGRFVSVDLAVSNLSFYNDSNKVNIFDPKNLSPYIYTRNNPIIYVDDKGESAAIAGALIGGFLGGGFNAGYEIAKGIGEGNINWQNVKACAAEGAISGAITGAVTSSIATGGLSAVVEIAAAGAIGGFLGGGAGKMVGNTMRGDNVTKGVLKAAVGGAIGGAIGGAAGEGGKQITQFLIGKGGGGMISSGGGLFMKDIYGDAVGEVIDYSATNINAASAASLTVIESHISDYVSEKIQND